MPVFDMAYDRPRMPLPMMALLRLKTDIPKEVLPSNCEKKTPQKQIQFIHFHCEMVLQVPILLGLSHSLKPDSLHYTFINVNVDLFRGRGVQQYWLAPLELPSFPTRSTHSSSQPLFQRADSKMHLSEKALQMSPLSVHFVFQGSAALFFVCLLIHLSAYLDFILFFCTLPYAV